jgi:MFS family permease
MPTWALTSSIAMTHSDPKNFPIIRTFGTIGWVASGLFSVVALYVFKITIDGTQIPLFCGAAIAIAAALQNLTLPDTPPSNDGSKFSVSKVLGLEAFSLLRDRNYLVFMIGSMATAIAFALYPPYSSQFLGAKGFANITVALNWGQFAEMFFMAATTIVLARFGVKKALIFGLLAMTLRYLAFYFGDLNDAATLYYAGILLHGFIFGWFFIGGQVYTTQKAPKELVAQAQGMFAFLVWGVATLVGVFIYGTLIEKVTKTVAQTVVQPVSVGFTAIADGAAATSVAVGTATTTATTTAIATNWSLLFLGTAIFSALILLFFALFFKEEKQPA